MVLYLVDGLLLQGPLPGSGPDLHQAGVPGLLAHFHPPALLFYACLVFIIFLSETESPDIIYCDWWSGCGCGAREVRGKWISENIKLQR